MRASRDSLEYGNPFDCMGSYPDVQGLSYGMGYKLKLHWFPRSSVVHIVDSSLSILNDRIIIQPRDVAASDPRLHEDPWTWLRQSRCIIGVQLSLNKNKRDVYIAYRQTAGKEAGVFVTYQDKDTPEAELVDMACHSPSQKDARLQPGWTFADPSSHVV